MKGGGGVGGLVSATSGYGHTLRVVAQNGSAANCSFKAAIERALCIVNNASAGEKAGSILEYCCEKVCVCVCVCVCACVCVCVC